MSTNNHLALTPPLGWNSWDCYGTSVREEEVKANADFMAARLAQYGWNYVVIDIQWYEPNAKAGGYRPNANLVMDEFGRLLPAPNRFPSTVNGAGFKPIADYIHTLGLRFGIHMMRGIPRQAVRHNLPILNSSARAQDIADINNVCSWNDDMYGVDMTKPGAQAYYDSVIDLYASWEVDYIKADNILAPYQQAEIEALSRAISRAPREIVLSLSAGNDLSTEHAEHLQQHCELWRISDDFWDRWEELKNQFDTCAQWAGYSGPGHWADADMLPLGHIGIRAALGVDRQSLFTRAEQITLMTLWAISRSPLMFGGDLPTTDDFTLTLLSNAEVLRMFQASSGNRELLRQGEQIVWIANSSDSNDIYLALFNLSDMHASLHVDLAQLGFGESYAIRDLWSHNDLDTIQGDLKSDVAPHGAKLFRLRR